MSKAKVIVPVVLIAATAAVVIWRSRSAREQDPNRLLLHGNIELTQVDLSFKVAGRVGALSISEGDRVQQGAVLARLDQVELEQQKVRDSATTEIAQSQLSQLRTAIDWQRETVESNIALKRADLAQSQARLAELEAGSRSQELRQALASVDEATTAHEQASRDWERAQRLYKNDDISTTQYDQFKARNDATAAALRRAAETLALVKEGPRKEQIEQARAAVEKTRAALRMSEANRMELKRREQEVAARQAEIARSRAQVAILDTQLGDRVLYAPLNALVLTKSAEAGEVLAAGATVVTLGDVDHPWVRAYISERDLGRVKVGMPASITTDSYPGRQYQGKVSFVGSDAEFTPKTIQTQEERQKLVYRIKIQLANPNGELKLNMPVDVEMRLN